MPLVTRTFSDIITFTRASSGAYFDATGTLQTATTNNARFDYNPSTLAARGMLVEEQRTNLLLRSAEFGTWWTPLRATVSSDAVTSPANTLTGDNIIEDTSNNTHQIYTGATNSAGTYTFSVFAKAFGRSVLEVSQESGGNSRFTLSGSGTATALGANTVAIQSIGNGWYRCSTTFTASGVFFVYLSLNNGSTNSYAGDGVSGITLWGAQLEAGAFATSYIATTTASATRSADVASVNTLSPWYNASAGTVYVEYVRPSPAAQMFAAEISDNTFNEFIGIYTDTAPNIVAQVRDNAGSQAFFNLVSGVGTANVIYKQALAMALNDFAACSGGGTVGTDTVGTLPTVTRLNIGNFNGSSQFANGWIRRITYYPRRLSNAELQAITA